MSFRRLPKDRLFYLREEEKYIPQQWRPTTCAQEAADKCWRGPSHAARICNDGLLSSNVLLVWNNHPKAFHAQVRNREKQSQNFPFRSDAGTMVEEGGWFDFCSPASHCLGQGRQNCLFLSQCWEAAGCGGRGGKKMEDISLLLPASISKILPTTKSHISYSCR